MRKNEASKAFEPFTQTNILLDLSHNPLTTAATGNYIAPSNTEFVIT